MTTETGITVVGALRVAGECGAVYSLQDVPAPSRDLDELRKLGPTVEISVESEIFPSREVSPSELEEILIRKLADQKRPRFLIFHTRSAEDSALALSLKSSLKVFADSGRAEILEGIDMFTAIQPSSDSQELEQRLQATIACGTFDDSILQEISSLWEERART